MARKTTTVTIGGKEITISELSVIGQLNIEKKRGELGVVDVLRECTKPADFTFLDSLSRKENEEGTRALLEALNEVNGWNKNEKDLETPEGREELEKKNITLT